MAAGSALPIDESVLIGVWLESFIWGIYTTVFFMTLHSIYRKRREDFNKFTTVTLVLLYALATGHVGIELARLIQGFILYRDTIGPPSYFADDSVRLGMAKDYLYITTLFLGDLIIVWRLYVVWGRNLYVAIFPMLMCLGELGVGYASISQWLAPHQNFTVMDDLGTAMFALSLPTNIIITIVTAARIWYVTSRTRKALGVSGGGQYKRLLILLVESGAFVAATKLTEFILFQLDVNYDINAMNIVYVAVPQITGLAPTFIIYAVNKGFTQQDEYYSKAAKSSLAFNHPTSTDVASQVGTRTMFTANVGASESKAALGKLNGSSSGSIV
ncbi:hypothetical protein C8Q77DRAFT_1160317 [Trametes polyzona]|nr:hypothetical protein C8Q77DRAFT_1160317 [Trametes polyzona]